MDPHKQKLLDALSTTIGAVQLKIDGEKTKVKEISSKSIHEIKSLNPEDQVNFANLQAQSAERLKELDHLHGSPFFLKMQLGDRGVYLAKHHFTEAGIYSWVAPIAAVRFENPGPVEYKLPGGKIEKANLSHKEQYLIVNGKVMFFAQESIGVPRELIYQEHFSAKKDGFVLPEIVAVMEKAQDMVIRAHHAGPFVISGPAGSGKTTLALHRVAYLVQAPDTAHLYPESSIIVFVQDNGTKEYFSHLLPELGINNVQITTFFEWACLLLGLEKAVYVENRSAMTDVGTSAGEFERLQQLASNMIPSWTEMKKFLEKNRTSGLDRIDITMALSSYYAHHKKFEIRTTYNTVDKNGEIVKKTRKIIPKYSLMIVDEFQNYMPEQLRLMNACVDETTKSVIYVGDMAQQVLLGTIRSWESIGHTLNLDREVRLHKVYRNTREIIEYIRELGYKVEIPEGLRSGKAVAEHLTTSEKEVIAYVEQRVQETKGIVGVIARETRDLVSIKKHFNEEKRVRAMTMRESQGVEFDTVCLVGVTENLFDQKTLENVPAEFADEKKKIDRDLLYVALTRAISELHIVGTISLKKLLESR